MGDYFVKILFAILICFLHTQQSIHGFNSPSHVKCNEKERPALLNFKHGLIDGSGMLSTWREDDNNSDCCKWKGIECNNETGHVHVLHLPGSQTHYLRGAINIISLFDLQNIQHLDLSFNDFRGTQIPQHMDSLKNLRYLNLSWSDFAGRIPHELGNLSKLEYLDLKENSLYGTIPSQLGKLTRLCYLDLSYNSYNLGGKIPSQLGKLTRLRYLDLSYNEIHGEIPYQLGNLSQLRYLHLLETSLSGIPFQSLWIRRNLITSPIPDGFGRVMKSLEVLDLESNNLQGEIPSSIGNIRTLQQLNLGRNNLQGEIPISLGNICTLQKLLLNENNLSGEISSIIQNSSRCNKHVFLTMDLSYNQIAGVLPSLSIFTSLKELYLSNNQLTGDITEQHLTNLSNLESLDLTDNSLSLKFGSTWVPPFQLYILGLASCKLGPSFPRWLQTQTQLEFLDISNAGIDDFVPDWFWNKLRSISEMNMSYNSLKALGSFKESLVRRNSNMSQEFYYNDGQESN
ncbi:receptor-like protein EIX1 [Cajanus cajan]|uniref:receptor-like protein EIX1 n=1 Tax=Cajanus cajan TaxID=3821 RepID=UPI0010FB02A1|nr:receptor-like protein EIX1 [Cajanus cajan]